MADQVLNVTIKGIGDFSDVVSNVNNVQKALTKLKLPDKLGDSLGKNIANFTKEYDKYQKKLSEGIKTQGDQNAVDKSLNSMMNSYQKIINDFSKLSSKDFKEIFNLDAGAFAPFQKKIRDIQEELKKIKLDPKQIADPMEAISKMTKAKPFDKLKEAFATNDLAKAKEAIQEIDTYYARFSSRMSQPKRDAMAPEIEKLRSSVNNADSATEELVADMNKMNQVINGLGSKGKSELEGMTNALKKSSGEAEKVTDALKRQHAEEFNFTRQAQNIDRQIQSYFGLTQMIRKVGNIARDAFNTVKELDKAMTETAVVTNFSVGDMWEMLPTYTEQANKLGSTIKDVYEAATLYYQQGLNTNQAMGLANETLKMARIGGLEAAEATDMMTAALRGFNMEINQTSAQRINDVYSQLAAITASNTREIGTAMEKTASLANSANMDFATTSAFLAQMIETTREAPENLGTAMKTIVARFQEMKKDPTQLIDSEGVVMNVNKVDAALKSIGVSLTNTKGEFRDLDDVFLEISSKWDSLTQGQQRYIATTAAGSRQQSRFIAMMSNYDRTMELVDAANNSAGASEQQFGKTMESMSSKLNQLKNAWDQFTMGLMNNQILKAGVTGLTGFFTVINKIVDVLGKIPPKPFEGITKSLLTLGATLTGLNFAKNFARGTVMAGAGWWNGEKNFVNNFKSGFGISTQRPQVDSQILYEQATSKVITDKIRQANGINVDTPVTVKAYLENIDASQLPEQVKNRIHAQLEGYDMMVDAPIDEVNKTLAKSGQQGYQYIVDANQRTDLEKTKQLMANSTAQAQKFTGGLTQMGIALQQVGSRMGPLGGLLSAVGSIMATLGTTLGAVSAGFMQTFTSSLAASGAMQLEADASIFAQMANAGLAGSFKALGVAIWSSLGPMALLAAGIAGIYLAYKAWDKANVTNEEKIEMMSDSAAKASEAYNSLKQESSELNDSLEQIQNNENSFDGLVAGTVEFNEKLTETNQKITELLQKYPELNDPKFLSTDKNGLMHINQEGIDFIKKRQAQLVGNASAQNIMQSARLKAEQNRQKAEEYENKVADMTRPITDIYKTVSYEKELTEQEKQEVKELEQKAKYLKESADNAEKTATQQALAASFTNIEAQDRERMASMYVDSYDAIKKQAEKEDDMNKMRQKYADYYGYNYDKATEKITNANGEEIEISDEGLKAAYSDIVATVKLQASADSFSELETDINKKFSKGLDVDFSKSGNVLSDVLSKNVETDSDALKEIAKQPGKVAETISKLSDEELGAAIGKSAKEVSKSRKKSEKELAKTIKDDTKNILDEQTHVYEDLGAMMAQSQNILPKAQFFANTDAGIRDFQRKLEDSTQPIATEISQLSIQQANTLKTVGETLKENVGPDAMAAFLEKGKDIYLQKNSNLTSQFDKIISSVNWESAASRLNAYTTAINSSSGKIREWGQAMRNSASEANILGNAFDEFVSGDWTELAENADDFKNSLGEIDGAGILKASEQSRDLKTLLDSGRVSATGVAMALQGIEDGKYSVGEVDSAVLQLLSSLNRLQDASLDAHNIIQNFDPGIDTSEGEDFVKENAEKAQGLYDSGKWGNEQLQNYIKLAAGEERWNRHLRKNKYDYQATTRELMKYVNTFKDGFIPVWEQMHDRESMTGKTLDEKIKDFRKTSKENDKLGQEFEKFKVKYNDDDTIGFEFGNLSTKELETYFQKIYGVSEEYSKLLLQNLKNYSGTIEADLRKNDLREAVQSSEFQAARGAFGDNKKLVLTDEELRIFKAAGGDVRQLALSAGYEDKKGKTAEAQLKAEQFRVYQTGKDKDKRRDDYTQLTRDYAETFKTGINKVKSLLNVEDLNTGNKFDLSKLIADTASKSFDTEQQMRAAYAAYRSAEKNNKDTLYEGMNVEHGLQTYEQFTEALNNMTESSQWVQVGETIGQQIVSALDASAFLDNLRNGENENGAAFTDSRNGFQFNQENFGAVIDQIKASGESTKQSKEDLKTYLSQSQETFKAMSPEKQTEALNGIVGKLNELKFNPQDIAEVIRGGLGTELHTDKNGSLQGEAGNVTLNTDQIKANVEGQLTDLSANISQLTLPGGKDGVIELNGQIVGLTALATGQNNPNSAFHRVGTMARGSRKGYTISGRPTLTGEEGEELVWEPKQNRAYMVGSNGPQFANISKNAVVWNADQTRRIKKNSSITKSIGTGARGITPIGTMAGGNTGGGGLTWSTPIGLMGEITDLTPPKEEYKVPVIGELHIENNSPEGKEGTEQTITNSITLDSSVKNKDEPKTKIKESLPNPYTGTVNAALTLSASVSTGGLKGKIQSAADKAAKGVKVNASGTAKVKVNSRDAETKVTKVRSDLTALSGITSTPKIHASSNVSSTVSSAKSSLNSIDGKTATTYIKTVKETVKKHTGGLITSGEALYRARGGIASDPRFKREGTDTIPAMLTPGEYVHNRDAVKYFGVDFMRRINHKDLDGALKSFGSAAKGRYGTIGPKDKGGLTLTGEKGFEIAWLPSENRSMILGADGPQMTMLPNDAVVYTHEQSKAIMKRKAIPAGSHYSTSGMKRSKTTSSDSKNGDKSGGKGGNRKGGDKGNNNNDKNKNKKKTRELIKDGTISSKIFNLEQKIAQVKIKQEEAQKKLNKQLELAYKTLKDVSKIGDKDIKRLKQSKDLNKQLVDIYNKKLKDLDKKDKATIEWSNPTEEKKNGKWKKGSDKKHKAKIAINKYIKKNEATGAYVVDYEKINAEIGKDHKNKKGKKVKGDKNKAKAVKEAAEKKISDLTSKRDSAQSAYDDSADKLEELGKTLYEHFYAWKNELTKILQLTKQIEDSEKRTSQFKAALELNDVMTAFGGFGNSLTIFKGQISSLVNTIQTRTKTIGEQRKALSKTILGTEANSDYEKTNKLLRNDKIATQNKNKANKDAAKVKADEKAIAKRNNIVKKRGGTEKSALKDIKKDKKDAQKQINTQTKKKKKLEKKLSKTNDKEEKKKIKKELTKTNKKIKSAKKTKATAKSDQKAIKQGNTAKKSIKKDKKNATQSAKKNKTTEKNILTDTQRAALEYRKQADLEQKKIVDTAKKYVTTKPNIDGTISVEINESKLLEDKNAGNISTEMYEGIKEYYDKIVEENDRLVDLYSDQIASLTELYETLEDLKDQYADRSEELLDSLEDADQKEIDKLEKLNSSLTDALNDLLNEFKNKLEQRRQQEDNKEKETDISRKQQRLAALRADSSGGNAVEIAQLEKEIAEAQKTYGRELEDQQLEKLQQQADEAAKQRERQIELMNAQLEVEKATGTNVAKVNEYLSNPELYKEEIYALWKASKEYDQQTEARQSRLDDEWIKFWDDIQKTGLTAKIEETNGAISKVQKDVESIQKLVTMLAAYASGDKKTIQESISAESAKQFYEMNADAGVLRDYGYSAELLKEGGYSVEQLKKAGFSATDFGNASISYADARKVFSLEELSKVNAYKTNAQKDLNEQVAKKTAEEQAKKLADEKAKREAQIKKEQEEKTKQEKRKAYEDAVNKAAANGKMGEKEFKSVAAAAKDAGIGARTYMQDLAKTSGLTWKQVIKAAKANGYNKNRMAATFTSSAFKKAFDEVYGKGSYDKARKAKASVYAYKSGGLASYTGPAWLDGTPSKPELVLNQKDTKNFLALRDVLSDVMGTVNSRSDSHDSSNEFNININVDKIENDYDVDRMVARVKKEITKSAGYRNVTQVRNFR